MNTPTEPTPLTDAATYPADCLGNALVVHRDCARSFENKLSAATTERDQLRAEVAALVVTKDRACVAATDNKAEADQSHAELQTAEREVERLHGCCEELHTIIDSHGYPSGIDYSKMESRAERAEAELATAKERLRSEAMDDYAAIKDLQRELAAERGKLDWVFQNCKVEANDYSTGNRDVYYVHDREDLGVAMKEDAK